MKNEVFVKRAFLSLEDRQTVQLVATQRLVENHDHPSNGWFEPGL